MIFNTDHELILGNDYNFNPAESYELSTRQQQRLLTLFSAPQMEHEEKYFPAFKSVLSVYYKFVYILLLTWL